MSLSLFLSFLSLGPCLSYPKVGSAPVVPEQHQVGVPQLPVVGHPQQDPVAWLLDPQLQVDLLPGVADIPGELQLPGRVQGDVVAQRSPRGATGRLVGSHQNDHQCGQQCQVHEGDVLETQVFAQQSHRPSAGVLENSPSFCLSSCFWVIVFALPCFILLSSRWFDTQLQYCHSELKNVRGVSPLSYLVLEELLVFFLNCEGSLSKKGFYTI